MSLDKPWIWSLNYIKYGLDKRRFNQFSEPMGATPKKTYIPGLPGSAPLVEEVYTSGAVSESFNYMIDIYIDDSYNEEWLTNQMRYSIIEVWPAFGVGDRKNKKINIISMPFQSPSGLQETNELKSLKKIKGLENALAKLENDDIQKVNGQRKIIQSRNLKKNRSREKVKKSAILKKRTTS